MKKEDGITAYSFNRPLIGEHVAKSGGKVSWNMQYILGLRCPLTQVMFEKWAKVVLS